MIARARREGAVTLIELMVSLAIFSVIALAAMSFMISSLKVNYYVEAQTDASNMGQQALDEMRGSLAQSKKLLDVNSEFLALVDLSSAPELAGELRLPKIEPGGSLSPRAGSKDGPFNKSSVGNALLYVEALSPFQDPSTKRFIDRYRFVLYYVGKAEGRIAHVPYVLDLVRVESGEYADFTQLDALSEEMEHTIVAALEKSGITHAWDPGAPPIAAFSRLSGARLVVPPEPKHRIVPARIASALPGVGRSQRGAGVIAYSIAPNDGDVPIRNVVPKYGQAADGFPLGFEVLVTGPGHGRKVFVRLVVAAEAQGRFFSREHQMLAAVWD
jgi:prepilin-type N-terminal cleavage/methylation domain-containing protein